MKNDPKKNYRFHSKEGRRNLTLSVIAVVLGIVFLFPIYWMLQISFKSDMETFGKVLTFFPHQFTIDPWIANLGDKNFLESLRNSFINGFLTMVLTVLFGIPAAYGMGRYKLKGYQAFLLIFLVAQMLPASLMLTPMYLTFSKMHLLGTFFAPPIAIAAGSVPFAVVTLRPYFKSVQVALDEAARIDGCTTLKSFFLVMIPAVKTGIITIVTISFLNGWNDLMYTMTFNVKPEMRPLTANIHKFQSKYGTKWNCIMAYGAILVLPVIIMFIFLQKYIVGGMTAGAVKE
jgi:multiple sugar transport system permease protein